MRNSIAAWGAGALLLTGCADIVESLQGESEDEEQQATSDENERTSVTIAVQGAADACRYHWNGEAASESDLTNRSVSLLEDLIRGFGGVENMTEDDLPVAYVNVDPSSTFHCTAAALSAIQFAGFTEAVFRPGDVQAYLPILGYDDPLAEETIVEIGSDGAISWNGEAVDLAGLAARARTSNGPAEQSFPTIDDTTDSLTIAPDPLIVVPAADVQNETVFAVITALHDADAIPSVTGCLSRNWDRVAGDGLAGEALPLCRSF